jgi:putative hydrolase of the HAD superfamily
MVDERPYDLLVLDYGGVITLSHAEVVAAAQSDDAVQVERPESLAVVWLAHDAGMKVVVLSNEIDRDWIAGSPVLSTVDLVIACTDNGILKPDRRAYQRALLLTECTASRALMVDNDIDNVRGARGAGLDAILFDTNDPNSSWAAVRSACGLNLRGA